jgi:hypothetical protein
MCHWAAFGASRAKIKILHTLLGQKFTEASQNGALTMRLASTRTVQLSENDDPYMAEYPSHDPKGDQRVFNLRSLGSVARYGDFLPIFSAGK